MNFESLKNTNHIFFAKEIYNSSFPLDERRDFDLVLDMIIHSGDISFSGEGKEVMDFIDWFTNLDYKYKIFIAGNHDFCLEEKDSWL